MNPILKAMQIKKSYKSPHTVDILKGIDLEIGPEEAIAIVGKSGEGKSTLLHVLSTLETPSSGSLEIAGIDIEHSSLPILRNRHIGFIFQQAHLLEDETVLDNVLMPARLGKQRNAKPRALKLLETVGLSQRLDFPAKLLSGGEKQRVAIARALMNRPALIFADEPSGNLDSTHSQLIQQLLLATVREEKKSLILVTHDLQFAKLCDRVFLLKDGILEQL